MSFLDNVILPGAQPKTPTTPAVPKGTTVKKSSGDFLSNVVMPTGAVQPKAPEVIIPPVKPVDTSTLYPKSSGLFGKVKSAVSNVVKKAGEFIDRPEEGSAKSQTTWGQFPSTLAENLPFVGNIVRFAHEDPEAVAKTTFEDVLTGVIETSKAVEKAPIGAVANFYPKPLKFNVPVLGEVTNRQFNAAERIKNGEDPLKVGAEEGIASIFDTLMLVGLAGEIMAPRHVTTAKTTLPKDSNVTVKAQPKSFRLYNEQVGAQPVSPEAMNRMIIEKGVNPGAKYNPELPTYFKMTGKADGKIVAEIVQIKPSYLNTITSFFSKTKAAGYSYTQNSLLTSGHDYDKGIQAGDIPLDKVYKSPSGILQPQQVTHTITDLAGKLDGYKPGLGKTFQNTVNISNPTPTNLIKQASELLAKTAGGGNIGPVKLPILTPKEIESLPPEAFEPVITKEINPKDLKGIKNEAPQEPVLHPTLVEETTKHLVTHGEEATHRALQEKVGATPEEATNILKSIKKTQIKKAQENPTKTAETILNKVAPEVSEAKIIASGKFETFDDWLGSLRTDSAMVEKSLPELKKFYNENRPPAPQAKTEIKFEDTGKEFNKNQLKKAGFGEEAMGFESSASIANIDGVPAIAYNWFDSHTLGGFSVAEKFRGKGIATQYITELVNEMGGTLDVADPNEAMMKVLKKVGDVSVNKGTGTATVKISKEATEKTQKEKVTDSVKEGPKTIKEIAKETEIKEPNVRRILGVGTKEGTFERVEKGVYVLKKDGQDIAWIETGSALESLPKLAADGFKADMVFLDIPYAAAGNMGGNRMNQKKGTLFQTITPDEFGTFLESVSKVLRNENTPLVYMFSQSKTSSKTMQPYTDKIIEAGFKPLVKGDYFKMTKDGKRFTKPLRPEPLDPEGIIIFNKTGEADLTKFGDMQFKLVRPKGYKTEKPPELLKQLIEMTTEEGDMVLDPFAGSGVTGAEAVKAGRKTHLIEVDENVIENVIKPRIGKAMSETEAEGIDASMIESLKTDAPPAKNIEEFVKRVEQLNKFAQSRAILRRTGGLSKKAAGVFRSKGKRGDVRLQDAIVDSPEQYMSTLAHELGHAMEYNLVGATNKDTFKVFGDNLSVAEKITLKQELKAITNRMVGESIAAEKPGYYYKNTELLARFLQRMFENPADVAELAPKALELLETNAVNHPIIQEYLDAVYSRIDKGAPKFIFLRDMRQMYQKNLGNRVGDIVWKEEVSYRAMKERAKIVIEKFMQDKFKGIKDSPEALFRAAEGITFTEGDVPQFGTRNFANAKTPDEEALLVKDGWKPLKDEDGQQKYDVIDDVQVPRFYKSRYTPAQARQIFKDLSPEGQKIIKEFTARKDEAKDFFNRDLIKQVYKINSDLEGWVHHYFEEGAGTITNSKKFQLKTAGTRKQRLGAEGYVMDFQKALTKALTDLEGEKVWNEFIDKQFARVTKPIAKDAKPDVGWIEVVGNLKRGVGTAQENKMFVMKDGKMTPIKQVRYQMPENIYQRYKLMREPAIEASKAMRVMNSINRYWKVNILFHPGSAVTNFISGGIQYSTKILTDFYSEMLTGNLTFAKTRQNLFSMFTVMTPKGWQDAPDWIYGGDLSNYYGQFGIEKTPGALDKGIDAYADKALKVYGLVERYWKKVIATAENAGDLDKLHTVTKEGLKVPDEMEKQILDEINKEMDLFGYDYDNVPMWMENYQSNAFAQTFKPFLKYPYKYSKHIANMIGSVFDRTKSWQERTAKILAMGTIMAMYAYIRSKRKDEQKTPLVPETAPPSTSTRGRLFIGTDEDGNEIFTRVAKYPFVNLSEAGAQFIEGNTNQGFQSVADMLGGIAPGGKLALLLMGIRNEFEQYTPTPVLIGDNLATFVPGTRILNDIARSFDPYQRKKTNMSQSFTSLLPVPTENEDLRTKLRGSKRTIAVPEEGNIYGAEGRRTTVDMDVKNYKQDILLGLFTGVYNSRISPDVAEAFIIRKAENDEKKKAKEEDN